MIQGWLLLLQPAVNAQSTRQSRSGKGDAGSRLIGLSYGRAVGRSAVRGL